MRGWTVALLAAALLGAACSHRSTPASDGRPDADGSPGACVEPIIAPARAIADDGGADGLAFSTFAPAAGGFVGVWQPASGGGWRIALLDASGAARAPTSTLWAAVSSAQQTRVAVNGERMALAYVASEGQANPRPVCMVGVAALAGDQVASVKAPLRVSDAPPGGTVLHEVGACSVAASGDGFVAVWSELVDDTTLQWSLLAQRFDGNGAPRGTRLTLVAPSANKGLGLEVSMATLGGRTYVAHVGGGLADPPQLSIIDGGAVRGVALSALSSGGGGKPGAPVVPRLSAARDRLIARAGERAALLDADGKVVAGPLTLGAGDVAPLGDGYLWAGSKEFLAAQRLDATLQATGATVGLSDDRAARLHQLVGAPDGAATAALYFDGGLRFAAVRCGPAGGPPPGPRPCSEAPTVAPLDDGCVDAVCHGVVRLDFLTLGVKGYAVVGAASAAADEAAARAAAQAVFTQYGRYLPLPLSINVSKPAAGLYAATVGAGDFGGFVLVGADSGVAVVAGGIVWAGRGRYWLPPTWRTASDLACGKATHAARATFARDATCQDDFSSEPPPSKSADALAIALRSNLAQAFAARGAFDAYVMLYTPSVGNCDPNVAEWLVVLSQAR